VQVRKTTEGQRNLREKSRKHSRSTQRNLRKS